MTAGQDQVDAAKLVTTIAIVVWTAVTVLALFAVPKLAVIPGVVLGYFIKYRVEL